MRILLRVLFAVAAILALAGLTLAHFDHHGWPGRPAPDGDPHRFLPYALILAAGPILALALGVLTGGIRYVPSGELEPDPSPARDGWFQVPVFREQLALRNAALAAAVAFALTGALAFVPYLALAETPAPAAVITLLLLPMLVVRLVWAGISKTWAAARLEDATLLVRPAAPSLGGTLAVRVTQTARAGVTLRRFDLRLVCRGSHTRYVAGRTRTRYFHYAQTLRAGESRFLIPGESHSAEATFHIPPDLSLGTRHEWRLEVRTRILGADYRTKFLFPAQ